MFEVFDFPIEYFYAIMIYSLIVHIRIILRLRYSFAALILIFLPYVNLFALAVFAFRRSPIELEVIELRERVRFLENALAKEISQNPR